MVRTGDERINQQFFSDLKLLFPQTQTLEVDGLVGGLQNVELKLNQIDSHSKELSSKGDVSTGERSMWYPIRPDVEDCSFFVQTGTCKFGPTCKFNHPVSTKNLVDVDKSHGSGGGSSSKFLSQIPCKFYQAGLCKHGASCRFNHSKSEADKSPLQLNIFGFPKRLGKMNCIFYLRTGTCGYGASCRFHHPDPVMVLAPESMNNHKLDALESTQSYLSLPLIPTNNISFVHQDYVSSGYQAPKCKPKVETTKDNNPKREPCDLNDVGLPIRPGKKVCWNYENLGLCKSGRACAYDHPKRHSSTCGSASASPSGVKKQETGTPQE